MIALSTAARIPFTPPWLADQADAPVFHIRAGSVVERGQLEAVLAGPPYNAGRVMPWDLADAAMDAARHLLDGEARGQVIEALQAMKASLGLATLPPEQRQLLIGVDESLMAAWPEYAALRQREARRDELLPLLAAKHFLVGWDNFDAEFVTDKDGRPSDDTLRALGMFILPMVGREAYRLLYAEDQRPLSPPPSKSGPDPMTSPAASAPRSAAKGGKSATAKADEKSAKSGKKTPV
jgi:hypothetical protein